MGKRFQLTESDKEQIKKLYLIEQSETKEDDRKFCHGGNVKSLEEIVGDGEAEDYIDGVQIRPNGVNGLVDKLELLIGKNININMTNEMSHEPKRIFAI